MNRSLRFIHRIPVLVVLSSALLAGQWVSALHFHPLPVVPMFLFPALLLWSIFSLPTKTWIVPATAALFFLGNWQVERLMHPAIPRVLQQQVASGDRLRIVGQLVKSPVETHHVNRFHLKKASLLLLDQKVPIPGIILLNVQHKSRKWQGSDRILVHVRLRRPENFQNPGSFDYRRLLLIRGIFFTAGLDSDRGIQLLSREPSGLLEIIDRWRQRIRNFIDARLPGTAGALLLALTIGDTSRIPSDLWKKFSVGGVIHVLSISGLHVSMFSLLAFALVRWVASRSTFLLLRFNIFKVAALISLFPMLFYVALAGAETPTIRSGIMISAYLLAILLDRESQIIASLALAALVISLVWPGSVMEISFQLSFASVLSIVITVRRAYQILGKEREKSLLTKLAPATVRFGEGILMYAVVSLAAIVGTAPLVAYHFNQFSLAGLFANPLVVPVVGFAIVPTGILISVLSLLSPAASELLLPAVTLMMSLLTAMVEFFSSLTWAFTRVPTPSPLEIIGFYGVVALLLRVKKGRRLLLLIAGGTAFLSLETYLFLTTHQRTGKLKAIFLDAGGGDATVIEFPNRAIFLVDGGGEVGEDFDLGRAVVAPFLWKERIMHVEAAILTAPVLHHFGGLAELVELFRPKEFWSNRYAAPGRRFNELQEALRRGGTQKVWVASGRRMCRSLAEVIACAHRSGPAESVAIELWYGETLMLLLSDSGRTQAAIDLTLPKVSQIVLKVPWHGGWELDGVYPKALIVSGPPRRQSAHFRHASLRGGIPVYATGIDGAVTVESDGAAITIKGYRVKH